MPPKVKRPRKSLNQLSERQLRRYKRCYSSDDYEGSGTERREVQPIRELPSMSTCSENKVCSRSDVRMSGLECLSVGASAGNKEISVNSTFGCNTTSFSSDCQSSSLSDSESVCSVDGKVVCQHCLVCMCFEDCDECRHKENCVHCDKCVQGFCGNISDLSICDSSDADSDASDSVPDEADGLTKDNGSGEGDSFVDALINWALRFKISLVALSALLIVLRCLRPDLPKDARTLLKTPKTTVLRKMGSGKYWHNGFITPLKNILKGSNLAQVNISVNIDGLPLSRSSSSALWPILCCANGKVFVVGAYHGMEKPDDANLFLEQFVNEAIDVVSNGLEVDGKSVKVTIDKLICDAPAKSFVLNIKSHNAYFGCTKCTTEGEYVQRRVVFPDIDAERRTDEHFRSGRDEDFHKGETIMLKIPNFGPVSSVVLDYLHLICLGVVKKMLLLWIKGPLTIRLSGAAIKAVSSTLSKFQGFMPREFVRRPRSLQYVQQFKGTEFRQFVLYTGPVALCNVIPLPYYKHFMQLHVALVIMCSKKLCGNLETLNYASALMRNFVEGFRDLYGDQFISHNVHNLVHLVDDVKKFGSLDNFSAFKFENFMQELKELIRKSDNPLPQLARRYHERKDYQAKCDSVSYPKMFMPHSDGILPLTCRNPQFRGVRFSDFSLDLSEANNCCGSSSGKVMLVENFATCYQRNDVVAVGKVFSDCENLYTNPLPSSSIGILKASVLGDIELWPLKEIQVKFTRLPFEQGSFALFPLLHHES